MKPIYQVRKNITMPRNTRRVYCPIDGCDERVISDLIPVDAITPTFPQIGVVKYGEIDFVNNPQDNPWADYVLRKIEPEGDLYSRLTFSRDIEADNPDPFATPFKVWSELKDKYWPPILHAIHFVKDKKFPHTTRAANNSIIEGYRLYKREDYTPAAREGTLYTYEHFVHSVKPKIPKYQCPQTSRVSFHYLGVSGEFPECLHDDLLFKSEPGAIRIESVGDESVEAVSVIPGQFFPATNFITWRPYFGQHTVNDADVLFESIRVRFTPPSLPETSVGA